MANEKRLIDANALIDWMTRPTGFRRNCDDCPDIDCIHCIIEDCIKNAPTVDAVEVVRCRDCVNYCGFEHCKNGICDVDSVSKRAVYPNDFCSYGERREA